MSKGRRRNRRERKERKERRKARILMLLSFSVTSHLSLGQVANP